MVVELGSGSGRKTRRILEALARHQPTTYCPIEISSAALESCERELDDLPHVSILGFETEYLDGLSSAVARRRPGEGVVVLFLGSSIGNFDRAPGEDFLRKIRQALVPGDALLLGTDLEKPLAQLIPAYDDSLGVTAVFNRNLLARINRELGGDFDLARFEHVALYNARERRIEMHLRSTESQTVSIEGAQFHASSAMRQSGPRAAINTAGTRRRRWRNAPDSNVWRNGWTMNGHSRRTCSWRSNTGAEQPWRQSIKPPFSASISLCSCIKGIMARAQIFAVDECDTDTQHTEFRLHSCIPKPLP